MSNYNHFLYQYENGTKKQKQFLELQSTHFEGKSPEELKEMWHSCLSLGMHGICFSAYEKGQKPGDVLTEKQVRRRLEILKPYTKWVRSFSCIEGNELIPKIAKELGMKTLVGAWLGDDTDKNQKEVDALIALSNQGYVDIAAVGNEVMYRKDLTEEQLIETILYAKSKITSGIPVGYVDAYYEFYQKPVITEICDVILCNCYPYWEGTNEAYSLPHMKDMYARAKEAGKGKKVIITETGWPSKGTPLDDAVPSETNAMKYFINTQKWSQEEGIEVFYFASFDEAWKIGPEGDVGAHWGLWDIDEKLKF